MLGLDKFSLSNRNVLLTGASGYLGVAMAWSLAECGATFYTWFRCDLRKVAQALRTSGLLAEKAVFDVTNQSEIDKFFVKRANLCTA